MVVNARKLAAIDLHFLGPRVILAEFALGVSGPIVLGFLTLRGASRHGWPWGVTLFGAYLISLGLNYVPLLLHAIDLVRSRGASCEIADELLERRAAFRRYRRQSLYLLVPLVVPMIALQQHRMGRNRAVLRVGENTGEAGGRAR
jgi:hypothetical protein